MKKRIVALYMSLALSLGICSPVNAISMQDEILTDNL